MQHSSGPALDLEQLAPASSAAIETYPAGFHAPPPHTLPAELTQYAQWLQAVQSPTVSDAALNAQLMDWMNDPAPVPLLQQRVGLLLRLGLVPWAFNAAQRLPNEVLALQLDKQALMWQLLYPSPWTPEQQQAYIKTWRPAMQAWLVNHSPQPLYAVWAKAFPALVERVPQKVSSRSVKHPPVYRLNPTAAQWVSLWSKTAIAQQFSYPELDSPKLAPLAPGVQRYVLNVWPELVRTLTTTESAYRLVDERLIQTELSPMARVQQREALLEPLSALHQKVRQCQARVAYSSKEPLPEAWQQAHGALVQWCKAHHWGLDHLRTAVATPPFMDARPELPDEATVLTTLQSANTELAHAWGKAIAETPEWTLQQTLFEAGHAPDAMRQVDAAQSVIQPLAQSVWMGLAAYTPATQKESSAK